MSSVRIYTPKRNPYADIHSVDEWEFADWESGRTLSEMFPGVALTARIDGVEVPAKLLPRTRLKDGVTVYVRPIPQADALLKFLPKPLAIALEVIFPVFFLATIQQQISGFITGVLTPKSSTSDSKDPNMLTGESNQVAKFTPIPRLLGRMRYFPVVPMTATPYTELQGRDQYLRYKLLLGYGPLSIGGHVVGGPTDAMIDQTTVLAQDDLQQAPIQLGSTDIHEFDDVEWQIGRPDQVNLYTDQIVETNPAWVTDVTSPVGSTATRTTEAGATGFSIDFVGRVYSTGKGMDWGRVTFRVDWKITGSSTNAGTSTAVIQSGNSDLTFGSFAVAGGLPNDGTQTYDIIVTKQSQEFGPGSPNHTADVTWQVLRSSFSRKAFVVSNTVVMDLRIKATDQLNGQVDKLSVLATSVLDVYDPAAKTWSKQATRAPAWGFASVLTDVANAKPLTHDVLDADSLAAWATQTNTDGVYYDAVLDNAADALSRLEEIKSAGYGMYTVDSSLKIRAVTDPVFGSMEPRDVVSPRTMSDYRVTLTSFEPPDALRVQYTDPVSWQPTERLVFWDGFDQSNAEVYLSVQAPGCTSADQAYVFGRRYLGNLRLRAVEAHQYDTNYRFFDYSIGDVVHLAHDAIMVSLGSGRVKSVTTDTSGNVTSIVCDAYMPMPEAGTAYGAEVLRSKDASSTVFAVTNATPGSATIVPSEAVTDVSPDDLIIFGPVGKITTPVMVTKIEPHDTDTATITAQPLAPALAHVVDGPIPPPTNDVTLPPDPSVARPDAPKIVAIDSDDLAAIGNSDGSKQYRLRVTVSFATGRAPGTDIIVQARAHDPAGPWNTVTAIDGIADFTMFGPSDVVDIRAQVISAGGMHSAWTEVDNYVMDSRLPDAPTAVAVTPGTFTAQLTPAGGDPASMYQFWRSQALLPEAQIEGSATYITTAKDLQDVNLIPGTTYYYYVRAVNQYGASDWVTLTVATSTDMSALDGRITQSALDDVVSGLLSDGAGAAQKIAADVGTGTLQSVTGSAAQVAQETADRVTAILAEAGARQSVDTVLLDRANAIQARTDDPDAAVLGFDTRAPGTVETNLHGHIDGWHGGNASTSYVDSLDGSTAAYGSTVNVPDWYAARCYACGAIPPATLTGSVRVQVATGAVLVMARYYKTDGTYIGEERSPTMTASVQLAYAFTPVALAGYIEIVVAAFDDPAYPDTIPLWFAGYDSQVGIRYPQQSDSIAGRALVEYS